MHVVPLPRNCGKRRRNLTPTNSEMKHTLCVLTLPHLLPLVSISVVSHWRGFCPCDICIEPGQGDGLLLGDLRGYNDDEIEEEYNHNQVVSVLKCMIILRCVLDEVFRLATLNLFNSVAHKVERGYDLVQRLHSERAMDLAIQWTDCSSQCKLMDRIEEVKLQ